MKCLSRPICLGLFAIEFQKLCNLKQSSTPSNGWHSCGHDGKEVQHGEDYGGPCESAMDDKKDDVLGHENIQCRPPL